MATNPPVLFRATAATKSTIVVSWGAPEGGTAPTRYDVRRDDLGTVVDVGLTNSHIFGSLEADEEYSLSVRAVSGDGNSAWVTIAAETLAFLREHFYRPVRNGEGTLMVGSTVSVFKAGTTEALDQTIFVEPMGDLERGPAWLLEDGVIDFFLELPQIVDLYVLVPGRAEPDIFRHQWVGDFLDVDRINDLVMAGVDDDENSAFREQQDSRHAAAYANKATETGLAAHLADATDAHDASAVSFAPAVGIGATTAQAAIEEIATNAQEAADSAAEAGTGRATAANFANIAHGVNTGSFKTQGHPAYDITNNKPVWATGNTPGATWVFADGTTAFTPA
jgi:Fibronectin type III domain